MNTEELQKEASRRIGFGYHIMAIAPEDVLGLVERISELKAKLEREINISENRLTMVSDRDIKIRELEYRYETLLQMSGFTDEQVSESILEEQSHS